ncbi:hypothetical protein J3B02_003373 [Coemansia erecta]|uniref:Uncharacterized protein n=1 Tax=Coemansia asiatica TaxID=1052880 RepID=A0A9W8CL74_9FUNG|nr:hypothetical protein LPJ64_001712 [Coemansia asiatica]KAJ2852906.1 hypothetical protein J3B02_003373 [Coemansia erecta]KAJ2880442.1 hypothetical protein FB639_002831 [Coemansia asiatica]
MQVFKTVAAIAALVATVFGAIDWTSQATLDCTKENWTAIKKTADQMLPMASAVLPPDNAAALAKLLNGATEMPANPSDDFLHALPSAIPASLLEGLVGPVISTCLSTHVVDTPAPTSEDPAPSSEAPPATTPDVPAPDSEEPAPTSEAPVPTATAPSKCIPRN